MFAVGLLVHKIIRYRKELRSFVKTVEISDDNFYLTFIISYSL